jgi:hypothetical protein
MSESSIPDPPNQKWERFLSILRCPATGGTLRLEGESLVSESGLRFPIVTGKPILVLRPTALNLDPPPRDKVSQTIEEFRIPTQYDASVRFALHLGAGNVFCRDPRVVSCDLLPNDNVDVVADAELLPTSHSTTSNPALPSSTCRTRWLRFERSSACCGQGAAC